MNETSEDDLILREEGKKVGIMSRRQKKGNSNSQHRLVNPTAIPEKKLQEKSRVTL